MESLYKEPNRKNVIYIESPDNFEELWNLVSDDPNENIISDEMVKLFPEKVNNLTVDSNTKGIDPDHSGKKSGHYTPYKFGYYTLYDKNENTGVIRVIGIGIELIVKHTIGENPSCWKFADNCGPIKRIDGTGPITVVDDKRLFDDGILNLIGGAYPGYDPDIAPLEYDGYYLGYMQEMPWLGNMIHIPVYDTYSNDHGDIYRCILIWNNKHEFKRAKPMCNYGFLPPSSCSFPHFSMEHFSPLGRSGEMHCGFRWISGRIINGYNMAETLKEDGGSFLKKIEVNYKSYYFCGEKEYYPSKVKRVVHIQYLQDHFEYPGVPEDTFVFEITD